MTDTATVPLILRRCDDITAADAVRDFIATFPAEEIVGLLYTPRDCHTVRLKDGQPHIAEGVLGWDEVFELRIFHDDAELRWLHESAGLGTAVILTELTGQSLPPGWETTPQDGRSIQVWKHGNSYLLWGEVTKPSPYDGTWNELYEPRIGALMIPVRDLKGDQRHVVLETCEYFAESDDDGNVSVFEERLLRFAGKMFSE